MSTIAPIDSRTRLLDAALATIRRKGYHATTVDDLCAATKLSKGSFFHHFKGKEDLALAAVGHWNQTTGALFAETPISSWPTRANCCWPTSTCAPR
jgi:TetR/AcrR family transcriptional regulator, transcriptional repressor for nem operon